MSPEDWKAAGQYRDLCGYQIFTLDTQDHSSPPEVSDDPPLVVVHGFPTSSFDFHLILDRLVTGRRVVLLDLLGFGLSEKPDIAYSLGLQADIVIALVDLLGLKTIALLTHDMGDSVGGELLARVQAGKLNIVVAKRVITNGSIYIELAHLTDGQNFLLSLPDSLLPETLDPSIFNLVQALEATLSAKHRVLRKELQYAQDLIVHAQGYRVLPRTIRYIEERRANQERFTGAIESDPSPLVIIWGQDDPIAVVDMAYNLHLRLQEIFSNDRPVAEQSYTSQGSHLTHPDLAEHSSLYVMEDTGHYPMLEDPDRFVELVLQGLAPRS